MARVNLSIPNALLAQVRHELPGLNLSEIFRAALGAQLVGCAHDDLECSVCSAPVDRRDLLDRALVAFYGALRDRVDELVYRGDGTAEGAAMIMRKVADDFGVSVAYSRPLPRPTKRAREAAQDRKLRELELPPAARRRLRRSA
jgi:hypothetical protein